MIGLLASSLLASELREFVFKADKPLSKVAIAGTFNGWNKGANPMKADADGRTWRIMLPLEPGEIQYKFVLDDNDWVVDPRGKAVDDGNGHMNTLLVILPAGYEIPAKSGDGTITLSALRHLQDGADVNLDRGKLMLALRARPRDIRSVSVLVNGRPASMSEEPLGQIYTRYATQVPWKGAGAVRYSFVLDDGHGKRFFGPKGLTSSEAGNDFVLDGRTYHPAAPPQWLERTVLYQIFPDRFANGDTRNDPPNVEAWDSMPEGNSYFGGDVAGVRQHMGYLKDLGITCVYFNPIFKSPVSHRYETADYRLIDPSFGSNQEFFGLTKALKGQGIGTIVDGVFNHSAPSLFAFADILKNQQNSKYLGWYTINRFPVKVEENPNYLAWWGYPSMPKLNTTNPETMSYLLGSVEYWQKNAGLVGWRLDVANEVSMDFWRAFRRRVKGIDANAWILGEEWGDANAWLKGDQWDASMNYPFREAVLKFVSSTGNGKPSDLLSGLMRNYRTYAPQVSRNEMNLIGSHDTPRILTLCGGDKDLAKLAAVIQMTWVGVPSVYYGDELGMEGDKDPDNRRGMRWDVANNSNDFLRLYKKLIATRLGNKALQSGDPVIVGSNDEQGTLAYARVLDGEAAVVVLNRSDAPRAASYRLPNLVQQKSFRDALSGHTYNVGSGTLSVQIPAKGAVLLISSRHHSSIPGHTGHPALISASHRRTHA